MILHVCKLWYAFVSTFINDQQLYTLVIVHKMAKKGNGNSIHKTHPNSITPQGCIKVLSTNSIQCTMKILLEFQVHIGNFGRAVEKPCDVHLYTVFKDN